LESSKPGDLPDLEKSWSGFTIGKEAYILPEKYVPVKSRPAAIFFLTFGDLLLVLSA